MSKLTLTALALTATMLAGCASPQLVNYRVPEANQLERAPAAPQSYLPKIVMKSAASSGSRDTRYYRNSPK